MATPPIDGTWKVAWITGASTGIGRELALQLARRGVKVAATARNAAALEDLARLDNRIHAFPADVTDAAAMQEVHASIIARFGPIDLAILNAGVWDPMGATDFGAARAARTMAVNYTGICHALEPLIPPMMARRGGQIALVSSVAGYRGLPKAIAYAPSKAAVISLAEVLRLELARYNVKVSLVNPGFVDTPMTAVNTFPMPYMLPVADAADRILKGLARDTFETAFPWQLVAMMKGLRVLPYRLYFGVVRRFIDKR